MTTPAFLVAAASLAAAPALHGSITVTEQIGSITVHGQDGTFGATAPTLAPWFTTINAGVGGPIWFAQSFIVTQWTDQSITIYPEALVGPGTTAPVLTQSLTQVTIRFTVDEPVTAHADFGAGPNTAGPEVTLNEFEMRLVHEPSGIAVIDGLFNMGTVFLAPGPYRVEAVNEMGNTPEQLSLDNGARMLFMDIDFVLTPACTGDITGTLGLPDGQVGVDDLNAILAAWNTAVPPGSPLDLAGNDGHIDVNDLNVILANWQACG